MKKCRKCGVDKKENEFPKCSSSKDGLDSRCKKCHCEAYKKYYEKNRKAILLSSYNERQKHMVETVKIVDGVKLYRCSECNSWYNENEFTKSNTIKRGVSYHCKKCEKVLAKIHRDNRTEETKKRIKEANRAYRQNNKERVNETSRKWKNEHKDACKKQQKEKYERHKEEYIKKQHDYYHANKNDISIRSKERYYKNHDVMLAKSKQYRDKPENKAKKAIQDKEYNQNNKEKLFIAHKLYREKNKERISEKKKADYEKCDKALHGAKAYLSSKGINSNEYPELLELKYKQRKLFRKLKSLEVKNG